MKLISCLGTLAALTVAHSTRADFMFTVNAAIPEGNPVGMTSGGTVSGLADGSTIASLSVGLNISGGYNGDLYGYLVAPGGNSVVLLNQPGVTPNDPFGDGGSGYNITLVDAATLSLQNTPEVDGVPMVGTFQPAGQLSSLNGINGNGTWTLYIADLGLGGGEAVLDDWSLDIATVVAPEPGQIAGMVILLGGAAGYWALRRRATAAGCSGAH